MCEQLMLHGISMDCRAVPCANCPRIATPESYLRRRGILAEGLEPKPLCDTCTSTHVKRWIAEGRFVPEELMRKYGTTPETTPAAEETTP